jgi:hypothetical protein
MYLRLNAGIQPATIKEFTMTLDTANKIIAQYCGDTRKTQLASTLSAYESANGRPTVKGIAGWITTPIDILERLCADRQIGGAR